MKTYLEVSIVVLNNFTCASAQQGPKLLQSIFLKILITLPLASYNLNTNIIR